MDRQTDGQIDIDRISFGGRERRAEGSVGRETDVQINREGKERMTCRWKIGRMGYWMKGRTNGRRDAWKIDR